VPSDDILARTRENVEVLVRLGDEVARTGGTS
jgi:hypothetical protein